MRTQINIVLFPAVTQLDLTGPYEVLARMPGAKIELVGATIDPVASDRGLAILPTTTREHAPACDLLVVPGGPGTDAAMLAPSVPHRPARRLRLVPVECDSQGLLPDALDKACRATSARVLYTMPTLHTPLTTTMPRDRRRSVAAVVQAEELTAIEDDAWGYLADGSVSALQTYAPDAVVYVCSMSKSIAPGLRIGYVVPPTELRRAITSCIGTLTWTPPLIAELVSEWIDDGTAASIVQRRRQSAVERQRLAAELLGPEFALPTFPAYHVRIPLPEPWRAEDFVGQAAAARVSLSATHVFVPGRAQVPHAVRVCTGTEASVERVGDGLKIVRRMLDTGPSAFSVPRASGRVFSPI